MSLHNVILSEMGPYRRRLNQIFPVVQALVMCIYEKAGKPVQIGKRLIQT